jgi:hypothetical protein
VFIGRRITDGAVFRDLGSLSPGDPITVVTPQGAFAYAVSQVSHVSPAEPTLLGPSSTGRLTLITSGSWFYSRDRLVVVATLQNAPLPAVPVPLIQLRSDQLGGTGDADAIVPLIPWVIALAIGVALWLRIRHRIGSRRARFVVATPPLLFLLFFLFENAAHLLPGTI